MKNDFELISEKELAAIVKKAAMNVAKRVQKDLLTQARKNVQRYYDQYDPYVYERTYQLRDNVTHIGLLNDMSSGNAIDIEVGFQYAGSAGYHEGNASPEWIYNNFLEGIHPNVNKGRVYAPYKYESQNELMEYYADRYLQRKIDSYMQSELITAFSKLK